MDLDYRYSFFDMEDEKLKIFRCSVWSWKEWYDPEYWDVKMTTMLEF